jgi:hypothetical protein
MVAERITVAIVLTPAFEPAQLKLLAQRSHVWLVGTEHNVQAAKSYWAAFPNAGTESSLTTFKPGPPAEPASSCEAVLHAIEQHHGTPAGRSPYTVLEVVGSPLAPSLEKELRALAFTSFLRTGTGFRATREAAT